jgi:hypothetical protein
MSGSAIQLAELRLTLGAIKMLFVAASAGRFVAGQHNTRHNEMLRGGKALDIPGRPRPGLSAIGATAATGDRDQPL